jgi:Kae1-associated kinase Bud32
MQQKKTTQPLQSNSTLTKLNGGTILARGAESIITLCNDNTIVKYRPPKKYRIAQIDDKFTKLRTRSEVKILKELHACGVAVPEIISSDAYNIRMQHIVGAQVKEILVFENAKQVGAQIGELLAKIHACGIVHGDFTTSNIIAHKPHTNIELQSISKSKQDAYRLFAIDFGLSYYSSKAEDRAVDLHVLRQAITSYHFDCETILFDAILASYHKTAKHCAKPFDAQMVLSRFTQVEKRGKNKH